MGFFSFFKKKDSIPDTTDIPKNDTKEDVYRMIIQQQAQRSPSELFASGSVFDILRKNRDVFYNVVSQRSAFSLLSLFSESYTLFLDNPQVVGFIPVMVNKTNNDTNPAMWNTDIFTLQPGDYAALLFMPIQNDTLIARIVGIILSDKGDGYYYCMLNKDEEKNSDVFRNKAMLGIEKVGSIKGLGFELMNCFLNCIKEDYYSKIQGRTTI